MIKVATGIPIVHRYDNIVDEKTCQVLRSLLNDLKGVKPNHDVGKLPWFEGDTQTWWQIPDINIRRLINEQRVKITVAVCEAFGTTVYPTFTDLSVWRNGKCMPKHKDNGYQGESWLYHRTHTAVVYLNDDYIGGETFIHTKWGIYTSVPKTGSMICFPSDESAEHGVNKVEGLRFTMPIWFCTEHKFAEDVVYAGSIMLK